MNRSPASRALKELTAKEQAAVHGELRRQPGPVRRLFITYQFGKVALGFPLWMLLMSPMGPAVTGWWKLAMVMAFWSIFGLIQHGVWRFFQVPAVEKELQVRGQSPQDVLAERDARMLADADPENW